MTSVTRRFVSAAALAAGLGLSFPSISSSGEPWYNPFRGHSSSKPQCHNCRQPECEQCQSGRKPKGPRRWSEEWYEQQLGRPVGSRQHKHVGKLWPPFPRPVGEEGMEFSHRYHAAHYWPWPYNCDDRAYLRDLSAQQVSAGWIVETTLYEYHFDPELHVLNHAGELQLRWILEAAPHERRVVFVQNGFSNAISQLRLANARSAAVAMVGEANLPPVVLRVTQPTGRPAIENLQIRQAELATQPEPRIQYVPPNPSAGGGATP